MSDTSSPSDAKHRQLYKRLDDLRRQLIGTDGRTRLINVNLSANRGRFLNFDDQDIDAIFRHLWNGASSNNMTFRATDATHPLDASQLQTRLDQDQLDRRLLTIYRESQNFEQELGINVLYLALGFLQWQEKSPSNAERTSPLLLLPVIMERMKRGRYRIKLREEELERNETLAKRLNIDFAVTLPAPDPEDETSSVYFTKVREAIVDPEVDAKAEWKVLAKSAQLGFFSFGKLRMYRDLDPKEGEWPDGYLEQHTLMHQLLDSGFDASTPPIVNVNEPLDNQIDAETALHVVDANVSQAAVLEEVRAGRSLVIQGPPGTGKSQTITNIIASAVTQGKSVLFVAEKKAALDVVHSNLSDVGLEDICLELHSNRAIRSKVYKKLGDIINAARNYQPHNTTDIWPRLQETRERLNNIVVTLHNPLTPYDYTAYGIMDTVSHFDRADLKRAFELPNSVDFTNTRLHELMHSFSQWHTGLVAVGDFKEHPLRWLQGYSLVPPHDKSVRQPLQHLLESIMQCNQICIEIERHLGKYLGKSRLRKGWSDLDKLMKSLADPPVVELARHSVALGLLADAPSGFSSVRLYKELKRWFAPRRHRANHELGKLLGLSLDDWSIECRRRVARFLRHVTRLEEDSVLSRRSFLRLAQELGIDDLEPHKLCDAQPSDWDIIQRWVGEVTDILPEDVTSRQLSDALRAGRVVLETVSSLRAQFSEAHHGFDSAYEMAKLLELNEEAILGNRHQDDATCKENWLEHKMRPRLMKTLETMLDAVERYPEWSEHLRRRQSLVDEGLQALVTYCEQSHPALDEALDVFEYALSVARCEQHIPPNSEIARLRDKDRDRLVGELNETDQGSLISAQHKVRDTHYATVPQGNERSMSVIRSLAEQSRPRRAIRQIVSETSDVLQRITPVLLTSPASVAQFIPVGTLSFDLVVFDEASQIPPEDAIGCILRAKPDGELVVVGDPQQLPPSRYFERLTGDDSSDLDDDDVSDPRLHENESILTMCGSRGLPRHMLKQHYRSKLPSLVEVSNHEFYDGELALPPSPFAATEEFGLRLVPIDGEYHPSGYGEGLSNTNPAEAYAICEALAYHAREYSDFTLGIAALSRAQSNLIALKIEEARREDATLDAWMHKMDETSENVFIKNLENVQGDERDVILISVGYGPQDDKPMKMNFGPINNAGGERRLNVLFTRARWRCEVFCSFDPTDITLEGARSEGRRVLKEYLMSAQSETFNQATIRGDSGDSYLQADIADEIVQLGYSVEQRVGVDSFVVDLAVRNPNHPDEFMLAVEADGATYRDTLSARERDRMRQSTLERYGWRYHRVWITEWFHDRRKVITKLRNALSEAEEEMRDGVRVTGSYEPPEESDDAGDKSNPDDDPGDGESTVSATEPPPDNDGTTYDDVPKYYNSIDDVPDEDIRDAINWARANNGDLEHEELLREVRRRLGFNRLGSKIRFRIEQVLDDLDSQD